jgi:hypothetical protein
MLTLAQLRPVLFRAFSLLFVILGIAFFAIPAKASCPSAGCIPPAEYEQGEGVAPTCAILSQRSGKLNFTDGAGKSAFAVHWRETPLLGGEAIFYVCGEKGLRRVVTIRQPDNKLGAQCYHGTASHTGEKREIIARPAGAGRLRVTEIRSLK